MRLLEIYLRDHWAGAGAGEDLARRLADNNSRTSWAGELHDVATQIEQDDRTLSSVRDSLGMTGGRWKRSLAQIAERLSRLKLNGRLVGYSPLSRVVEVEALIAGVEAKRLLWTALEAVAPSHPELAHYDLADLERRADEQLDILRRFHRKAVAEAFTTTADSTPA